jgi:hypothetical protein
MRCAPCQAYDAAFCENHDVNLDPRDPSNLPITFGLLNDRTGPPREPRGCGGEALAVLAMLAFLLVLLGLIL